MMTLDEQFEDLYGPLAPYSDYKRGERIAYRAEGQSRTGKILWVAGASTIAGREIPTQYIVECDQHSGIPDVVMLGEIVIERENSTMSDEQGRDASALDTAARPFKQWLRSRLKRARRDSVDNLAKKLLSDVSIPAQGSRSLYLAHLKAKGYSAGEIATFSAAWRELFLEEEET